MAGRRGGAGGAGRPRRHHLPGRRVAHARVRRIEGVDGLSGSVRVTPDGRLASVFDGHGIGSPIHNPRTRPGATSVPLIPDILTFQYRTVQFPKEEAETDASHGPDGHMHASCGAARQAGRHHAPALRRHRRRLHGRRASGRAPEIIRRCRPCKRRDRRRPQGAGAEDGAGAAGALGTRAPVPASEKGPPYTWSWSAPSCPRAPRRP